MRLAAVKSEVRHHYPGFEVKKQKQPEHQGVKRSTMQLPTRSHPRPDAEFSYVGEIS